MRSGLKQKDIAEIIGKDPSAICRELKRNSQNGKYKAKEANAKVKERRLRANARFRKITNNSKLKKYIIKKLSKDYYSPEQIAGELRATCKRTIVCHETIYQFIYKEKPELKEYLRCRKGKYKRRYGSKKRDKKRKEKIEERRIDKRPEIVEKRIRLGDWEGDTIVGRDKKSAILTHVDRKSGYLIADVLERALAETTRRVTVSSFNKIPKHKRKTITYDNGSEFAEYEVIEKQTGMNVYLAYPYHSWERGTNENTNGLLRQFFPKKTDFTKVSQKELNRVVKLINHRPRKRLHYLSPYQVFVKNCNSN